jgi:ATP-dependent RNA helicase RhlE
LLQHLLRESSCKSAIVFTRTKHRAKRLADQLGDTGHRAVALQGNMSQSQRDRAMGGFRRGEYNVLVATDIAARGIDVSHVSHVINFDVPNSPEAYTHRIGRTGRGEQEGRACTFVTAEDGKWVEATERFIGAPIARCDVAPFRDVAVESSSSVSGEPIGLPDTASRATRRDGRSRSGGRTRFGRKRSGRSRR